MFEQFDLTDPEHAIAAFKYSTYPRHQDWRKLTNVGVLPPAEFSPMDFKSARPTGIEGSKLIANASARIRAARHTRTGFDAVSVAADLDQGMVYTQSVAESYIRFMTNPQVDPLQKFLCFKSFNDVMNAHYNGIRKFDELHGTNTSGVLKAFENFRKEFTQSLSREMSQLDPQPKKKWYQTKEPDKESGRSHEFFERMIYNTIEDVNISERNASGDELGNNTVFRPRKTDSLEDYESNCAHCAPVTMATMYGANLRAGSRESEYSSRVSTKQALPGVYDSTWKQVNDLDHLFDTIDSESWPDNTFAFIHWSYPGTPYAHITIAGKVNGRACIIEGQTQAVITRDAPGQFRQVTKDKAKNEVSIGSLDPTQLDKIQFLHVRPATKETEISRVERAWEAMYPSPDISKGPGQDFSGIVAPPNHFGPTSGHGPPESASSQFGR